MKINIWELLIFKSTVNVNHNLLKWVACLVRDRDELLSFFRYDKRERLHFSHISSNSGVNNPLTSQA